MTFDSQHVEILCQRNEQVLGYQKDYVEGFKQKS